MVWIRRIRSLLNYIRRLNEEQGVTILICTHLLKQFRICVIALCLLIKDGS